MFSLKRKSSQETLSDREGVFLRTSTSSGSEESSRSVLEERRDHLFAQAKSEILKEECKVDTLNTCIREFQRQVRSNRLEMDYINFWYEEISKRAGQASRRMGSTRKSTSRNSHQKYPSDVRVNSVYIHDISNGSSKS